MSKGEIVKMECKKCHTTENVNFEGMCKKCYEESVGIIEEEEKEIEYVNSSDSSNMVANKFTLIVIIIKVIGYITAVVTLIAFLIAGEIGQGFLFGIIIAVITWFSTLAFEAIAEILNLLQDIKNKL